jgi:hypothetical protein
MEQSAILNRRLYFLCIEVIQLNSSINYSIMSSSAFRPHGLIKSPIEEALYHRAHIANVYTGIADPKEHETSALMEVILYSNVFTSSENFIVNSQQPPTTQSDKKCDIVIRYLESGTNRIRVLCFAECKRTRTSQPFSLKALEKQAKDYSRLYLDSEDSILFVYVATMAGAHIRLWTYWRDKTELAPFWGSQDPGKWDQYKDVGDNEAGRDIEYWFGIMKQFPPTPHAGQSSLTYGTSSTGDMRYQPPASGYGASASGYQAPASGYQTSPYAIPHLSSSNIPTGQSTSTGGDMSQPTGGEDNDSDDYDEDDQTVGYIETQQVSSSSAGSHYHVVKVTKKAHRFGNDEFNFKDKRGKLRSTARNDWRKTTHNGRSAWRHRNYICTENIF